MTEKNLPPVEYLRKRLRYEPETGKLFWRDCEEMTSAWRKRHSGKEAFKNIKENGYKRTNIIKKSLLAHRVAWAIFHGKWPLKQIDHINGVRDDNRITNLREASSQQNNRNSSMRKDNTSGVSGVTWQKREGLWMARIKLNGRYIFLGYFETIEDAAAARAEASAKHGFSERHGEKAA